MEGFVRLPKKRQRKLSLEEYAEYKKRERAYDYENSDCARGITKKQGVAFCAMASTVVDAIEQTSEAFCDCRS